MTARTVLALSDRAILETVTFLDIEGLRSQRALPSSHRLFKKLERILLGAENDLLIAYWPDGVFGFVSMVPPVSGLSMGELFAPQLIATYQKRFSEMFAANTAVQSNCERKEAHSEGSLGD